MRALKSGVRHYVCTIPCRGMPLCLCNVLGCSPLYLCTSNLGAPLFFFVVEHAMAISLIIRICNLVAKLLAHAIVFFYMLYAARAIPFLLEHSFSDFCNKFCIFIHTNLHCASPFVLCFCAFTLYIFATFVYLLYSHLKF